MSNTSPFRAYENVGWTVGNHCNAKCGHCYSWKVRRSSDEFLTVPDIDRIVGQLARLGVKTVNLGGNEPIYTNGPDLSASRLPYIIRALHDAQILVGLTTNGVTFAHLDQFHPAELRLVNDIDFSLDSPYEREHNANRGANLFRLVISSIQRARALDIDCSVITCGMASTFSKEYLEAFLVLTQLLGCEFRINTLKAVEPVLAPAMPTPDQYYAGFSFLMQHTDCITLGESCLSAVVDAGSRGCPCGTSSFRINAKTADGRVPINPCVYLHEFAVGDLLRDDIFDILSSPTFVQFRQRRDEAPTPCRDASCPYIERCRGGCAARTFFATGTLDARDPYCPLKLQEEGIALPVFPHQPPVAPPHGVRVHDNYLCTWIGVVNSAFHTTDRTLDDFCAAEVTGDISPARQTRATVDPSLVGK